MLDHERFEVYQIGIEFVAKAKWSLECPILRTLAYAKQAVSDLDALKGKAKKQIERTLQQLAAGARTQETSDTIRPFLLACVLAVLTMASSTGFGVAFGAYEENLKGGKP